MATKAWILIRLLIHSSSGLAIFIFYGLIDWICGPASERSLRVAFGVLTFFTFFLLTWADVLELYIEPRLRQLPSGVRPWRRLFRAFLDRQVTIRKTIYGRTQREHEATSFMASTHLMWGLWLSYLALWKWGPAELHFTYFIIVCMTASWADPAAAVFGRIASDLEINRPWPVLKNPNKTLLGSIGCLAAAIAVSVLGLMATGFTFPAIMLKVAAVGFLTTLGEALAGDQRWRRVRLDDNFIVPLCATAGLLLF